MPVETMPSGPARQELDITGMTCASCSGRVERALRNVEGVSRAVVSLVSHRALVEGSARIEMLVAAVTRSGFTATPLTGEREQEEQIEQQARRATRQEALRVLLSALLTAPLLLPMLGVPLPGLLMLVLAGIVQIGFGYRFYIAAWRGLRAGAGNMDQLVAIGTSAAFLYSAIAVLCGDSEHGYFDASAVVISLILFGRWLESRARQATGSATRALSALRPDTARLQNGDEERLVPASHLMPEDIVIIRPGERFATDGEVASGQSEADESLLTGESHPVPKHPGDSVIGGAMNGSGLLRVRVTATVNDGKLARVISLVREAEASRAPVQRLVDQVAAIFVPAVVTIAVLTFLGWWIIGHDIANGFRAAVSVLVIACPCALGLATPAALVTSTGIAARRGILIRDAASLERAGSIDTVALDKTGTITEGKPVLHEIILLPSAPIGMDKATILRLAAAAESGSTHPLAHAVRESALTKGTTLPMPDFLQERPGEGVIAHVSGHEIAIGNAALFTHLDIPDSPQAVALEQETPAAILRVAIDRSPAALLLVEDTLRPGAAVAIRRIHATGCTVMLLTGDTEASGLKAAKTAGIELVETRLRPEDKAARIAAWQAKGHVVAMVGDGVNDAPSLAQADLGIAIGTGADAARHAAGIILMRPEPGLIADAISLSRATRRKIRQNLFWAFIYNAIGLPFAALGLLNPVIAGAAMAFSSVSVVVNALLLKRWKPSSP
ncbi:heavy metal translocating P-type ATPase [Granulibacter bethesdensis]|uniref:heavy metal translocating P-type ATPase n=1 Tax=Granulibacter bethesdensis TaxID=364410 RepID=UPI00090A13DB|nr:heavy metal translocating P-type ATPase [Granulibacter bethesdensis]APH60428.1 Copper-exporting ATPase [Granulibacter bethesdensis]